MAMFQRQSWGGASQLRDLDYVNPRPKMPSTALPPEVRKKLGLERGRNTPPPLPDADLYHGAVHAHPKVGQSGAGTNWQNPNGHAFVRKGSGAPASVRAPRRVASQGAVLMRLPPEAERGDRQSPAQEASCGSRSCGASRASSSLASGSRSASREPSSR